LVIGILIDSRVLILELRLAHIRVLAQGLRLHIHHSLVTHLVPLGQTHSRLHLTHSSILLLNILELLVLLEHILVLLLHLLALPLHEGGVERLACEVLLLVLSGHRILRLEGDVRAK
jgi:hypothetical protein